MPRIDCQTSKTAIGVALILGSMLIVLGYSTLGNSQSASAVVSLQPQTNSQLQTNLKHSPTGTTNLVWDPKQLTLTVRIDMTGLAPNSIHPAHVHKGSCETGDGGILYPLNPVMIQQPGGPSLLAPTPPAPTIASQQQGGNSSNTSVNVKWASKTTIPQVTTGIPASGWFINVYNGPALSLSTQKTPIACVDIINFNTSTSTNQFVDLTLGATKGPNQAANGVTTFSLYNDQLIVTVTVSGLAPSSTHQAHIHLGSCGSPGPVVYPLTPVVANEKGNGTSTTTIPHVTSIPDNWYVNVHLGATAADLKTQTGFDPLVCGNVTLGY